jgi:hypothetical protein
VPVAGTYLSDDDLLAVRELFQANWAASVMVWKERGLNFGLFIVSCPDSSGVYLTKTGQSLSATIDKLLADINEEHNLLFPEEA